MKKNKLHRLDLIFIIGIILIGFFSALIDAYCWKDVEYGGFPVYSTMSIYASYALWFILLIYSSTKYKENVDEKPKLFKWYMFFVLPFFHIACITIGLILSAGIVKFF